MLWKLDLDEDFFRIYDSKKMIAGYFDPDFGINPNEKNHEETISQMLKNHDAVCGGLIMVPLVKFRLFDTDLNISLSELEQNMKRVTSHLQKWNVFISKNNYYPHSIRISHTDQDMLTITFTVKFPEPVPLEKKKLLEAISTPLDMLQKYDLL